MKKKLLRILISFSIILTVMFAISMTAMAATEEVEGIQAEQTVDTSDGNIKVTLKVTAENGYSIDGITLSNQKPDGYKLLSGNTEQSTEKLKSGESKSLTTVFTKDTGAVNTGDSNSKSILIFGGLAILSAALIIFLITRRKKWNIKIFSLFLCCVLVASCVFAFPGKSYASENEGNQVEFSKDVTVGNEKVIVKSVVSYYKVVENIYTVTFDMQEHGTQIDPITDVTYGSTISAPDDPTAEMFTFKGWYKEETFENKWEFDTDTVTSDITLYAKWESMCIAAGTMISMPEGKQKAVEELEIGDVVCTFDHETGEVSSAPVCFIWESKNVGNAFTLTFEGGIEVTVIEEHGFYDQEEQKYVFINIQNAKEYIGHHFYNADSNNGLELKSCEALNDSVDAYAIITSGDLNHMSNGMLSMCDGSVKVLANLFEYDDQMKFDEEKMQADIDEYGLMPKEKILELDGFIETDYDDYNLQYMNVAIGKGLTTWEWLEAFSDYCVANGY